MNDELTLLSHAANKAERTRSRQLARAAGMPLVAALRATLIDAAGAAGLEALLAARSALRAQEAAHQSARAAQRAAQCHAHDTRHLGGASAWQGWFDGSARPNPGHCGIGFVLRGPAGELVTLSQAAGLGDSADAEYQALIALLEAARAQGAHALTVYGDSRVVLDDVSGTAQPAPGLYAYRAQAQQLSAQLPGLRWHWLPRQRNSEADALAQHASRDAAEQAMAQAALALASSAPLTD